ncbi:hypothetical protein J2T60_001603 [Natronospira proteinivora]|uniref:Uncharacterized protein n=1 Tax=Natronospira proteinivora TaxID=1807133 RepID=A0ABT1G8F3_9GAMM|nr:hypothetical protein [Natronospira proteinivora]MCP1727603.1 hypothetical protein [Natronospira proteinivora]
MNTMTIETALRTSSVQASEAEVVNAYKSQFPNGSVGWVDGWSDALHRLIREVEGEIERRDIANFEWAQIKSKFGTLRAYYEGPEGLNRWVEQACREAAHTCQVCGREGRLRQLGRKQATLCVLHAIQEVAVLLEENGEPEGMLGQSWPELGGSRPLAMEASPENIESLWKCILSRFARQHACAPRRSLEDAFPDFPSAPDMDSFVFLWLGEVYLAGSGAPVPDGVVIHDPANEAVARAFRDEIARAYRGSPVHCLSSEDLHRPADSSRPLRAILANHAWRARSV